MNGEKPGSLPSGYRSGFTDCGEVRLHFVHNARDMRPDGLLDDNRPAILFLHGFPEYWAGWKPVLEALGDKFLAIAPDQRGYNLSDAPQKVSDYSIRKLVSDMLALACNLLGPRKFHLAGHDWGAAVAYAFAIAVPERVRSLTIVNGVHPVPFQNAIIEDPEQRLASQYFHTLRAEGAADRMSEDGFRRTFSMFEKFSSVPWLGEEERSGYRRAWSMPGRLEAMLNWYRASPILVPKPGETTGPSPLAGASAERFMVTMPHLLLWGENDQALRPSTTLGLERFAPKLERVAIPGGDHWSIHTHAGLVARELTRFVGGVEAGTIPPR